MKKTFQKIVIFARVSKAIWKKHFPKAEKTYYKEIRYKQQLDCDTYIDIFNGSVFFKNLARDNSFRFPRREFTLSAIENSQEIKSEYGEVLKFNQKENAIVIKYTSLFFIKDKIIIRYESDEFIKFLLKHAE